MFSQADSLLTDSLGIEGIETKNFGTLINLGNTYTYTCAQYRFSSRFGVEDSGEQICTRYRKQKIPIYSNSFLVAGVAPSLTPPSLLYIAHIMMRKHMAEYV